MHPFVTCVFLRMRTTYQNLFKSTHPIFSYLKNYTLLIILSLTSPLVQLRNWAYGGTIGRQTIFGIRYSGIGKPIYDSRLPILNLLITIHGDTYVSRWCLVHFNAFGRSKAQSHKRAFMARSQLRQTILGTNQRDVGDDYHQRGTLARHAVDIQADD